MNRDRLASDLILDEEVRLVVYDDKTGKSLRTGDTLQGNATIGVGRNLHEPLSEAAWRFLLNESIETVLADIDRACHWFDALDDVRQRAVVNMVFNLGLPRFLNFKKTIAAIERGDWQIAAIEALDSTWAQQVGARATRIAGMLRTGTDPET